MTLAAQFDPRHNGITLLRLLLAVLVVYGHAYELGHYGMDPGQRWFGVTCGELGVNTFFSLSGFLVTQSYLNTSSTSRYLLKRGLRIFPGFWVCLLLTAFVLAPVLLASRDHQSFFQEFAWPDAFNYVGRNAGLLIRRAAIGDLFAHQPADRVINGSLWSLFPEALCYLGVAIAGGLGWLGFASRRGRTELRAANDANDQSKEPNVRPQSGILPPHGLLLLLSAAVLFQGYAVVRAGIFSGGFWIACRYGIQAAFFLAGMSLCVFSDRVPFSRLSVALCGLVLALVSFFFGYGWAAAPLLVTYLAFGLAIYCPFRAIDRLGDWSYGVYIYHYPVLQTIWFFGVRPAHAEVFFLCALPPTAILAVLSWRYIEAPALRWKTRWALPNPAT